MSAAAPGAAHRAQRARGVAQAVTSQRSAEFEMVTSVFIAYYTIVSQVFRPEFQLTLPQI